MTRSPDKNRHITGVARSIELEEDAAQARDPSGNPKEATERLVGICFSLVAQGRLSALSDLYDLTAANLFGYIRSIVGSSADAEDVFQEVFAKIAARGPKLARVNRPLAYMFTIARNEAFSLLKTRARSPHTGHEDCIFAEPVAPEAKAPALAPREAEEALSRLPTDQREAIVLKIYECFTFAEIARITGVSTNTAASRYRYGLAKLARLLKKRVEDI